MPMMFDYACNDCGARFEAIVFSGEQVTCEKCQSEKVQRVPSVFTIAGASRRTDSPAPPSDEGAAPVQETAWGYSDEKNYHGDDDY